MGATRISFNCNGIFIHFQPLFFSKYPFDQFLPSSLFVFILFLRLLLRLHLLSLLYQATQSTRYNTT